MLGVGIDVGKFSLDLARHDQVHTSRFDNTPAGIALLIAQLASWGTLFVVIEATGGYEMGALHALLLAKHPVSRVNPRQARQFARATGQLAKTDTLDARALALMAQCMHQNLAQYRPPSNWQSTLAAFVSRRAQVVLSIQQHTQQIDAITLPQLRKTALRSLRVLHAERDALTKHIQRLLAPHLTPAWQSIKGLGPIVQATLISRLPELGSFSRQQIAKLVGLAPLNRDSGTLRGRRGVFGGRADVRAILYMAALVAIKWQPEFKAFYKQLRARGKIAKVAIVACMRKFLVVLNARIRDEMRATSTAAT